MQNKPGNISMDEAMRLAKSPAGQQLLDLLNHQPKDTLSKAADLAAAGDFESAKQTLQALLSSPEAQALMQQLGGTVNE